MLTSNQIRTLQKAADILSNLDQEARNYFFTTRNISGQSVADDINELIEANQEYYDEALNSDEFWAS